MENNLENTKYFFIYLTVFSLAILPYIPFAIASTNDERYHTGYFYYGYDTGTTLPPGVRGEFKTIKPNIDLQEMLVEYLMVITSYRPTYWVSTGYHHRWEYWVTTKFFAEKYDSGGQILEHLERLSGSKRWLQSLDYRNT